jgi:hypothetical protein
MPSGKNSYFLPAPLGLQFVLFVLLYGRNTWSPALRKEHGLKVYQTGVLMRTCGP